MENGKSYLNSKQKWVFLIVANAVLLGLCYKLIFNINVAEFSFSELLALLLALFSIGISVAFYFKATDSSNKFYDNTYKFTKDIAELLVKIESSFGEKLSHLDESYTNMRDKFDKFSFPVANKEETEAQLDESKKELEKKLEEKEKLLNDALQKAHTDEVERKSVIVKLTEKEVELENSKEKLNKLENKLKRIEQLEFNKRIDFSPLMKEIINYSIIYPLGKNFILNSTNDAIRDKFRIIINDFSPSALDDFIKLDFLDKKRDLTDQAIEFLRKLVLNFSK